MRKRVKELVYREDGSLDYIRDYDDNEIAVRVVFYDESGNIRGYNVYEYDGGSDWVRLLHYSADGTLEGWTTPDEEWHSVYEEAAG